MSVAALRLLTSAINTSQDVPDRIRQITGHLPQIEIDYEPEIATLWITLKPEPKPVFTLQVIESVAKVQDAVISLWSPGADNPVMYLAYRSLGPIFSLGGDLDFYLDCLRSNDLEGLRTYADYATRVIRLNRTGLGGRVITLSNVRGKAIGGGIDPARACNLMVAEEGATFSYPEVHFNHYPIAAVPVLSRHTGLVEAERILMSGEEYSAREFLAKGALDDVVPCGEGDDWIRKYAGRTMATHRARVALFAAFDRMAGVLDGCLGECAQSWADHILSLRPLEIAKLQRIASAQERLLARMLRDAVARAGAAA